MDTLDLHGMRHEDARKAIIRFIEDRWGKDVPVEIVTGHIEAMRVVAKTVLHEYQLEYHVGGYLNINPAIITTEIE